MPRLPKVRNQNGYWFSHAGGKSRYFGRVDQVSFQDAQGALYRALASDSEPSAPEKPTEACRATETPPVAKRSKSPQSPRPGSLAVSALTTRYLEWVKANRAAKSRKMQALHLRRFGERFGSLDARSVTADHLESFQTALTEKYPPVYVRKHVVTVRAMFNRAAKLGWLPADFRPFSGVETVRVPQSPVLESDLMTPDEVRALLAACPPDMADLLRCYHATGARTSELIEAGVGDYQPKTRQLVLGRHKREKTLRNPAPRIVTLNDDANAIISGRAEGRWRDEPLFTRADGRAWNLDALSHRMDSARNRAGLRAGITVYSFRHLWISEALMAGVDVLLVAKMAGTSVAMVERVYGHFRSQSLRDAQERLDRARRGLA